ASRLHDVDAVRHWRVSVDGDEPLLDRVELARAIRRRRSVRDYSEQPLPKRATAELLAWAEAPIPADAPRVVQQRLTVAAIEGLVPGVYDASLELIQARDVNELRERASFVA